MYAITTKIPKLKETTNIKLTVPASVAEHCNDIADLAQESMQILTVDAKNKMIDRHMVTLGLVDSSLVHPREIFKRCIEDMAVAFIMLHNHPSGEVEPSAEDIRVTKQIKEASKIMDIQLLDHVILGKRNGEVKFFSMRETGTMIFN